MHTADRICNMIDFFSRQYFVKFGGVSISSSYWNGSCSIAR